MTKLFNRAKAIVLKIDDFREEKLEDFISNEILAKLDNSKKIDELEKQAILTGIRTANIYIETYGVPEVPEDIKERIANAGVKALGKANKLLQKQLNKKSKGYIKRHKEGKADD